MPAPIIIRDAMRADYPGFLAVARETLAYHVTLLPAIFREVEVAVPRAWFEGMVAGPGSCILLAAHGGREGVVVGYATLQARHYDYEIFVPRVAAHIDNFGIAASSRGQGIGALLLAACRQRARAWSATSLDLDCWDANQDALRFYLRQGMRPALHTLTQQL